MKTVAVRNIDRASADTVDALGAFGVATVHEAQGRAGLMKPYITQYTRAPRSGAAPLRSWPNPEITG